MVRIQEIVFHMLFITVVFLPLFGSLYSGFGGCFLGRRGSVFISTTSIFITLVLTINIFYKVIFGDGSYCLRFMGWIHSGLFYCDWAFLFDPLTVVLLFIVTCISTLVHYYSSGYMSTDPHLTRFMSYLSLFTFFMLILITADNFIQMFVGWEGVGFCSFLLINFWFTRLQANKAAIKAMIINRISDFALVLGLLTVFVSLKSIEYASVFGSLELIVGCSLSFLNLNFNILNTICFLFLIGAMGKSAQIFLHTWLPDAMEGPTPVSALIHAATMVTAGIFLIARCSPLFETSPMILKLIIIIGSMTAFFAGTIGLTQNDLKKVIAYSTCSQLGYMFFACGLSNYNIGIYHLSTHAFFKALLFLSAGSVIHALDNEQDMRKMGGLRRLLPYTYIMFVIGSLSLMGFPFLTGFYSKDAILEIAFASHDNIGHFAYWLGTMAALCTAFYSTRLLYLTFLSKSNGYRQNILNAHDSEIQMAFPLSILAFGSIFIGYLWKDMFMGFGTDFWRNAIYINPANITLIDAEFLPTIVKLLPVICSIFGLVLAFVIYHFNLYAFYKLKISWIGVILYNFLNRKWFFDKVYHELISQNILYISYFKTYKLIDRGIIEILGPYGLSIIFSNFSFRLSKLHTGYIYNYSLLMVISCLVLIGFVLNCYSTFVISCNVLILLIVLTSN